MLWEANHDLAVIFKLNSGALRVVQSTKLSSSRIGQSRGRVNCFADQVTTTRKARFSLDALVGAVLTAAKRVGVHGRVKLALLLEGMCSRLANHHLAIPFLRPFLPGIAGTKRRPSSRRTAEAVGNEDEAGAAGRGKGEGVNGGGSKACEAQHEAGTESSSASSTAASDAYISSKSNGERGGSSESDAGGGDDAGGDAESRVAGGEVVSAPSARIAEKEGCKGNGPSSSASAGAARGGAKGTRRGRGAVAHGPVGGSHGGLTTPKPNGLKEASASSVPEEVEGGFVKPHGRVERRLRVSSSG